MQLQEFLRYDTEQNDKLEKFLESRFHRFYAGVDSSDDTTLIKRLQRSLVSAAGTYARTEPGLRTVDVEGYVNDWLYKKMPSSIVLECLARPVVKELLFLSENKITSSWGVSMLLELNQNDFSGGATPKTYSPEQLEDIQAATKLMNSVMKFVPQAVQMLQSKNKNTMEMADPKVSEQAVRWIATQALKDSAISKLPERPSGPGKSMTPEDWRLYIRARYLNAVEQLEKKQGQEQKAQQASGVGQQYQQAMQQLKTQQRAGQHAFAAQNSIPVETPARP